MKILFTKYELVLTTFLAILNPTKGQDVVLFKKQIPAQKYADLVDKEQQAQAEPDPLIRASKFTELASEATTLSDSLGQLLYERAMEPAVLSKNDSMIARVWMRGSIPFINTGQYSIAEDRLAKALDYWLSSEDSLDLADCLILQAYLERLRGRHYLALENLHRAKVIQSNYLQPCQMWNIANRTMLNYGDMGDFQSAVDVGEEYLSDSDPVREPRGYNLVLRNTGNFHFYNKNYPKAREYIEKGLPAFMVGRYPKYLAHSYSLLCDIAIEEENYQLANDYADSTIYYSQQFESPRLESSAHISKYKILKKLGQNQKLSYHINRAYIAALASNHKQSILTASELLADFEASQARFKKSYQILSIADSLRKEIFSEELTSQLGELEKRILLEKSQKEIDLLNEQNELKEQNLEKADRLSKMLVGLLILALGSLVLIFFLLRQRSLYNKNLEGKNETISKSLSEKELLLKEIHHRVKNNLQFISALLRLQSEHIDDPKALDALQQGHDRVRSMALIHQNLYKEDNLVGVNTKEYFSKLINGLFKSNNIHEDRIQLYLNISELNLHVDTIVPLGLITNELITNSLKYAFPEDRKGRISVQLYESNDQLILQIKDDGVGLSNETDQRLGDAFGYKLIQALVRQQQGTIEISNVEGTAIHIILSKYQKV